MFCLIPVFEKNWRLHERVRERVLLWQVYMTGRISMICLKMKADTICIDFWWIDWQQRIDFFEICGAGKRERIFRYLDQAEIAFEDKEKI